jgi:hypothetical protein
MIEEVTAIVTEFSKHTATPLTSSRIGLMFSIVTETRSRR